MELSFKKKYQNLKDKDIVMKIITKPYDEEAATYLLYDRYYLLFFMQCKRIFGVIDELDGYIDELFIILKGPKLDWKPLASFQWRCSLGSYLKIISKNLFVTIKKMIEQGIDWTSIDIYNPDKPILEIPSDTGESETDRETKIMIMEVINNLKDEDQRFILLKTLQGFRSKEIAIMLQKRWDKNGIFKLYRGEPVIPSEAYVNVERNRAYKKLKILLQDCF